LFILTLKGDKSLYNYKSEIQENIIKEQSKKANEMETYLRSNIEFAEYNFKIH